MSSPQKENGYTAIAHELLEQIILAPIRGQQYKCLLFLLRKTYGYGKKSDRLSLAQWAQGTGIERHNVWREVQGLIACNMIHVVDNGPKRPKVYSINKNYDTWQFNTAVNSVVASDYSSVVQDNYKSSQSVVESVVQDDYTEIPSVVEDDYKSVVIVHENTIDNITNTICASEPSKPKKEKVVAEPGDSAAQEFFAAICWLVLGHQEYGLLTKEIKTAIGKTVKEIRASEFTLDDLRTWYRDIWSREWPGKQRDKAEIQRPTLSQIKTGIGRVRASSQNGFAVPVSDFSPILEFSLEDIAL